MENKGRQADSVFDVKSGSKYEGGVGGRGAHLLLQVGESTGGNRESLYVVNGDTSSVFKT